MNQGYKHKRPPSDSSSSSSSSDEEKGTKEDRIRKTLKERKIVKPNLKDNDLDIEFIKESLMGTDSGIQFGKIMETKGYKFTIVHKIYPVSGKQDIYARLKEYGCLPMPDGMQCPYCKWNRYNGDRETISRRLDKHMQITHLISNNNHALNMLLNVYGNDCWMNFEHK
jgi:hypothetical protein